MVSGVLRIGLLLALRLHMETTLSNRLFEGVFWQVVRHFGVNVTASVRILQENRTGIECQILGDKGSYDLIKECALGNCGNSMYPCQTLVSTIGISHKTPVIAVNSLSYHRNVTYTELETALCCTSTPLPVSCPSYSPMHCSRYLGPNCTPNCTLPELCTPCEVTPCAAQDQTCQCLLTCSEEQLTNDVCDQPCNTSACNYDHLYCLSNSASGLDMDWTTLLVGAVSAVCLL